MKSRLFFKFLQHLQQKLEKKSRFHVLSQRYTENHFFCDFILQCAWNVSGLSKEAMGNSPPWGQTNFQSRTSQKSTKFDHSENFPLVNVPEMKIHIFSDDEKSKKYKIVHLGKSTSTITWHRFILYARARFEDKIKYFKKFLNARHSYSGRLLGLYGPIFP